MLIRTLCEISGPTQSRAMELGAIKSYEKEVENEVEQVNKRGRIAMRIAFDRMKELLTTLDDALLNNAFLRKWLRARVRNKQIPPRGNRGSFRGGKD